MSLLTLSTLAELKELPRLQLPPGDLPRLWSEQAGWWAAPLKLSDWQVEIPALLADQLAERARRPTVADTLSNWRADPVVRNLCAHVEHMLEHGTGFALMCGLPVTGEAATDERISLLFGLPFAAIRQLPSWHSIAIARIASCSRAFARPAPVAAAAW